MSKISQRQQMNVPIRTRNNEQVQTDVNLISSRRVGEDTETRMIESDSRFFEFTGDSWLLPFSDYYLLSQLNTVIQQLKTNSTSVDQYKTRKLIDELAAKIHGLLARQLKVTSKNGNYYDILLDKEKQITRLEIKYANFDKKIEGYLKKIQELERQISNLRSTLKNYQNVAEQNQIYKGFFREIKQMAINSRKITDFQKILNDQIIPKIKQYEINLSDVSKSLGRDRSSKQKAALSRYALELDGLSKMKELSWETLSGSISAFYSSLEHLNNDDWIQQRIGLSESYNQLRTRHIALISLVSKNVNQLLKKDASFKGMTEIAQFIKMLQNQNKQGYETSIVNGWIGLGVIHCHRAFGGDMQSLTLLRSLLVTFQIEMNKLLDKYPQLKQAMTIELKRFIEFKLPMQLDENAISWLRQIMVRETEVIHVEDVYNYYDKSDKQSIYYLRVLVKALVEELKRISNNHKIAIELDEAILQLIRVQVLDGINVDDIIALFRPSARVCEVDVMVQKPVYYRDVHTIGVPLKQQKAVIATDISHFAVNVQEGVPYRKQIPHEVYKTEVVQVPIKIEKPYPVNTIVTEQVVVNNKITNIVEVPVTRDNYIEVVKEVAVTAKEEICVPFEVTREVEVPFHTNTVIVKEVPVNEEVLKPFYVQTRGVVVAEQAVPKVYKESKFEIVDRPIHHFVIQNEIQFIQVEKPIIQRHEIAKPIEVLVEKPIRIIDHCDCQRPDVVTLEVQKPLYQQLVKQVVVEKCHFIQGGFQQRIVKVACHTQIPIFIEVVKQIPIFMEKLVPFQTQIQKLVVVDRQVPFFIQHFTPIQLVVQKPVIVKDIRHIPVEVETPVPVYIEKVVPKIVEIYREKVVEKIVEVPRVEIVEKIVERIVTIPRIVERIVTVPHVVEVPVFIETPVLEIIQVPVEKIVVNNIEVEKIVHIHSEVLVVEKAFEIVSQEIVKQVRTVIQKEPKSQQVIVEKIVQKVVENPVQLYNDRIVDRVVHVKDVVAVPHRVEVPIQIQKAVQIIIKQPIYYPQPIVELNVQKVQRDKIVEVAIEVVKVQTIDKPYIVREKEVVQIPGDTIVLKQAQLHIVEVQKENIVHTHEIHEIPANNYLYKDTAHIIDKPEYVVPPKQLCFLEKPVPLSIQKPVELNSQEMVVIERPDTKIFKVREGPRDEIVKLVTNQTLVIQTKQYPQPVKIPDYKYNILYQELPPKEAAKTVLRKDKQTVHEIVQQVKQIPDTNTKVITKVVEVSVEVQKIFEKILMLPQIVEVQKRIYMIEEINSLIAKEVHLETHYDDYRLHMTDVQSAINDLLMLINAGKQGNIPEFKKKLSLLLELLRTQSRIPKVVETIKEVEVVREKDRPVLVPVYESEREVVLHCIINDLVEGIKGFSKAELEKRFPERIINLFAFEFGLLGSEGQIQGVQGVDRVELQSRWKSWLDNYDKNLPNTIPREKLTQAEELFIIGYDSKDMDYATIRASLQKLTMVHKQRLHEIQRLKGEYTNTISVLREKIQQLELRLRSEKYYKDLYFNEFLKVKKLLAEKKYDELLIILQRIIETREQLIIHEIGIGSERRVTEIARSTGDEQARLGELMSQLTNYENDVSQRNREIYNLRQDNDRLRIQIEEIKLGQPSQSKELAQQYEAKYEEWKDKIAEMEQNHFFELNHLRDQLVQRASGLSTTQISEQMSKNYDELMKKYTELSQSQMSSSNDKKNLVNSYEQKIRDLTKELINVKRDYESFQSRSTNETSRMKSEYESKFASQSGAREKELVRQIETLKRSAVTLEQNKQAELKRLREDYEKRMTSSASNQEKELRRELDQARRSLESAEQRFASEKKRIVDDYETKTKLSAGNLQKELRRQIDQLKKNNDSLQSNLENQKRRLTQQYEAKLRSAGSSQERELRRQLDTVKKNYENYQKNSESQKTRALEDNERRVKQLQDELERAKSARKGQTSSPDQAEELVLLKEKIRKLELQLDSSKKQVETYQKSRLGQTTYTSGIKQSLVEDYQSPTNKYRSGGHKFEEAVEGGSMSREQEEVYQRSSEGARVSKSGVRSGDRGSKQQQGEQIRSSSSRVSGGSETSAFKGSMTMKQFMDLKKADDKDSIMTMVMIKVIEKIQEEADKGIVNSYTPNNIYLSNFNPNNLDSLIVRFGAPITNRKSKVDGLYLAPEVLRGEGTTLKSVVFTLAVIWDELIHYEIYYKKVEEIENLAHEYKVRDTSLNPILRNTLFEMMSKDASKRLELGEAKRRLSLQRYIVSEGRAGTTTSRVSTQSRKL